MRRVPDQIRRQVLDDPLQSPFYKPFLHMAADISGRVKQELSKEAKDRIATGVVPTYRRFLAFFEGEYLTACPEEIGVRRLPDGQEMYRFFARKYTTTDLSPEEIHETGLREVQRIRDEMVRVVEATGFRGAIPNFIEDLRTNPRFYCPDEGQLLAAYRETCARIDAALPRLFSRLPRVWYDIRPVPETIAPDTTTAYYRPPSADGKRPGTYFVNLFRPDVRPKYEIEALSLHEAVPGHHLQIALAAEIQGLPAFRRYAAEGEYTGYVEGWALYAESLGQELGCYRDPYSLFGRLSYEMWRAVRLVVDTGIHAFGWTRNRAIAYFCDHTAKAIHDIENEVDRYIAWPGQALAYKIGELEFRRLRTQASDMLGESFDLKEFHAVLLNEGAVPLDVLAANVGRWLQVKTQAVR
jgi:prolyl oligopeptidase